MRLSEGEYQKVFKRTRSEYPRCCSCTSKSGVSRRFIKEMDKLMEEFFTRLLDDDYPVIMLDGMELGKMTILAAMGINWDGRKRMLGIIKGGSENNLEYRYPKAAASLREGLENTLISKPPQSAWSSTGNTL